MAKTTAPLFGFGASGQLGKSLVFGKWKGINVARVYAVPANPNSTSQQAQRGYYAQAVENWHTASPNELKGIDKEAWNRYAGVLGRMSGFNAFIRDQVNAMVLSGLDASEILRNMTNSDTQASTFDCTITNTLGGVSNVSLHMGTSKSFFPFSATVATVAGVATFANQITPFSAGETAYFYFTGQNVNGDEMRSGLYTAKLT